MTPVNVALWVAGVALMALGFARLRGPLARLRTLQAADENARRYESWRGSRISDSDRGVTGADLMRQQMRSQLRLWGAVVGAGFMLVFIGFAVR